MLLDITCLSPHRLTYCQLETYRTNLVNLKILCFATAMHELLVSYVSYRVYGHLSETKGTV